MDRRAFLKGAIAGTGGILTSCLSERAPAILTPARARPVIPFGVQSGDIAADRAIVWSRSDRTARMLVEWSEDEALRGARRVLGPIATAESDFTARVDIDGLPAGKQIFYRVRFEDPRWPGALSEPALGMLRTAPLDRRDVAFAWSGDMAGQGWGINPERGGMKIFESMRRQNVDFFVHSGDQIYADNPIQPSVTLDDGSLWKNVTTPAKARVAETLTEFRGNFAYNLLDESVRRFYAEVPSIVQWDDHEVRNNWYPGQLLNDDRYTEKRASVLAQRARRAMLEYSPIRAATGDRGRIYRTVSYGPSLDLFVLDLRSYRGPNTRGDEEAPGPSTAMLGEAQLRWLKEGLATSRATWKVIASDMPIGLIVPDKGPGGEPHIEGFGNGSGPPRGREIEIADLLRFMKEKRINNVVWITADVHYAAAHHYDPDRARFRAFEPFWEFVAGPLNAGTFGPADLDDTFGPEVRFLAIPKGMKQNRPPSEGLQFFGTVRIDGQTEVMQVALHNLEGTILYKVDLPPSP
ncbi:MAG TPA: alkaline phosphatase D family protein [Polyangiaceae bacterium]|nr:alkaline phosphatase D family protein [Polyangiaceae bacterium]